MKNLASEIQSPTIIRLDERGQHDEANAAHERFVAFVETQDDSDHMVVSVARRLGRKRALAVMIEAEVIDLAARMPAAEFAALVEA
ncbi:hypothetical protein [Novosphingobium sp. PASSN1]|uniref:hypothetical protein n=1 Tax=Novosphingobium sp. PASSN1 TaxID=2015561 RepID=UPI000BCE23C1|nr:hypothetical protein [Novosphingobium sp. PASSN1]OYU33260.1 MAG: hypothetical protein CFE35_21025 [Novosphingobium sp. PASSN1]